MYLEIIKIFGVWLRTFVFAFAVDAKRPYDLMIVASNEWLRRQYYTGKPKEVCNLDKELVRW